MPARGGDGAAGRGESGSAATEDAGDAGRGGVRPGERVRGERDTGHAVTSVLGALEPSGAASLSAS
ncbi:hypothetical protein AQJ30_14240 [Streptomyces longwoodensis]|uniref:Uncharacterized protein n=1 Tax=Streptomyces longwoodensis TaxID=68231 RepID=A0A117QNE6_9ACTN|nr:hypothetical protein AQJ30_14240 [Streptomyces longwoodensis]